MTVETMRADAVPLEVRLRNAEAAVARYGNPAQSLRMIGVTGTNGKTTTVHILRALLDRKQELSASIGTLGVLIGAAGDVIPGGMGLTTPGPEELQRVLHELVQSNVKTVVMEVSSHALDQHRIHGITFDAIAFTNLTRDHLDYHKSMDAYFAAKASFVDYLKPNGVAAVNGEDPAWNALPPIERRLTFGVANGVGSATCLHDVCASNIRYGGRGSIWTLSYQQTELEVRLPLIGDFNVSNALCAAAVALGVGIPVGDIAEALSRTPQVPGRLEILSEAPTVLRDYAHTPDALERALAAVRPFARGRIILVFGAGGDRDPGKRPIMGGIAERGADVVIVTSDNPRTESPGAIIDDIEQGMTAGKHHRIEDRRAAIAHALSIARGEDVVLLAGKGHETYQVIGTERFPFDEKEIVQSLLAV
jgi:UDP-N-acetylmuramoyl-L-alanyl-D-glutamate--2,6-diaminopimelate ligase